MIAIYKREVGAYFKSILGYLFIAFMLVFAGIYTMVFNLSGYYANFEYTLESICFIYMIAVPILTMRSVAEEKRQKTDQLLYSLPMRLSDVVMGKYLALLTVLAVPCLIMGLYPLLLSQWGNVSMINAYSALLAFFLLGACLLAIGMFISSVTESQVAAAVISLVTLLILYYMNALSGYLSNDGAASLTALMVVLLVLCIVLYLMIKNLPVSCAVFVLGLGGLYIWYQSNPAAFTGLFASIIEKISLFDRFYTFVDGVFDLTNIVYFLSVIAVFLFLSVQALEKRRWND